MTVLLTGATGFLGSYLCSELLRRTTSHIVCLVRADKPEHATARIHQTLAGIGRLDSSAAARISAIAGDLKHENLGLSEREYGELTVNVDAIYHCAADINLAAPYVDAKPVNVDGTARILELAQAAGAAGRQYPRLHYVSTLGIFSGAADADITHIDETSVPTTALNAAVGYARSKIEAENLVRSASAHGIAATIYRPGAIIGDYATGRSSDSDVVVTLMKAMLALRAAPLGPLGVYADTVDAVAAAISALSQRSDAIGKTFHHVRPDPLLVAHLVTALRNAGYRLPAIPPQVWWKKVERHADDPRVLPVVAFGTLGAATATEPGRCAMPSIRSEATWQALRTTNIAAPPLDSAYLARLVAVSVSQHPGRTSIPAPPNRAAIR